jgi:hypothetical protein
MGVLLKYQLNSVAREEGHAEQYNSTEGEMDV